ncbi:MAG: dihydroorotase [Lacibacter sp.]
MTILIRQAQIVDPTSPHHQSRQDVFIENGIIREMGSCNRQADQVIERPNLHLSPGWMDVFAHFCDPGLEQKETIETGIRAAAAGGFTDVLVLPNTQPTISGKTQVEYVLHKAAGAPVRVHPMGAISKNIEGKDLAEMYDMHQAGAVAFTDGLKPVQSAGLLLKALQYTKAMQAVVVQLPDDTSIARHGLMNEGIISTRLGLPGKPALAEEIMVQRDLQLLAYTESKLHLTGITTAAGLQQVAAAKAAGLQVSASVTPAHLYFSDADLQHYDTNLKLYPPLRTEADRDALRHAVVSGTIDCIASHHMPHEYDSKTCEFEFAQPGMLALETAYGVTGAALQGALTPERWVQLVAINPRTIFGLAVPSITAGNPAVVTLFDPSATYTFTREMIRSRSANTPFVGKTLTGKVYGIINQQHILI